MKPYIKYIPYAIIIVLAYSLWRSCDKQDNDSIDMQKYILKEEMNRQIRERDSIIASQNSDINVLIDENRKASTEATRWYKLAQERSKNPNYNIDFITASSIISNSRYKPTE